MVFFQRLTVMTNDDDEADIGHTGHPTPGIPATAEVTDPVSAVT
jgi:hypothetical protein